MAETIVLADALDPDRNSFNLVRLAAALSVIVSHSFLIPSGIGAAEPLRALTSLTLGQHAVNIFFVISGLTLARSLDLNPNITQYAWARLLRIVPALIGFGLVFAFMLGPFVSSARIADYYFDWRTWVYPLSVPFNFQHATPPPLVFENTPVAGAVNNPLWTIKYEIFAYIGLGIFASIGLLQKRWHALALLFVAAVIMIVLQPFEYNTLVGPLFQATKFAACFLLGVSAYSLRGSVPISPGWIVPTAVIAVALSRTTFAQPGFILLDAHFALVFGSRSFGWLTRWTRRNDLSYGAYIYGWPVQQAMVTLIPGVGPFIVGAVSIPVALVLGYLSWIAIERPALRLKRLDFGRGY